MRDGEAGARPDLRDHLCGIRRPPGNGRIEEIAVIDDAELVVRVLRRHRCSE